MKNIIRIIWHTLPLIPIFLHLWYAAFALILLVLLAYIKTQKLAISIAALNSQPSLSLAAQKEVLALQRVRARWLALTFLPQHRDD